MTAPSFPPVPFNASRFVDMIRRRGLPVTWEKAMFCPSRKDIPNPGDHDPNCTLCDGSGWLYVQPKTTQMIVQGATLEQAFYIQGRFDSGVATITTLPEDKVSYWDRIILTSATVRYSELIQRREGTLADKLRYRTLDVIAVQYKTTIFVAGRDFRVENNHVVWTSNDKVRPPDRAWYSILTERRPVYLVLDLMKQHREVFDASTGQTSDMPLQVQGKLDFLVRDESKEPKPPVTPQSPFQGGG